MKKAVKYINIFLLSLFLIACTNLEDTNGKSISEKENKLDNPQFSKTYPVNIESDNYSSRLTSNFIDQFIFFEDQGYIVVNSKNLDSVDIFINDNEIDTSDHEWNDKTNYMIDISNQTKNGKNTIQVSNIQGENASLTVQIPYATVINNEEEYIDNKMTKVLDEIIEGEINYGFPSAQLTVIKNGKVKMNRSYGYLNNYYLDGSRIQENKKTPVTEKTLFDLASNTKMYVTNYALQYLISEDRLSLDTKVSKIFPEFVDNNTDWKNMIEIKDLLYHQAGFPPDPQYHNNKFTDIVNNNGENGLFSQDKITTKKQVLNTPLEYEPRTESVYSDVDYMLLGYIIEELTNKSLDTFMRDTFYDILQLENVTFNPLENGFDKNQIAATEINGNTRENQIDFKNIRTNTIQGEVHDEKAFYSMDGISGHAGLFSNSLDLAQLAQIMLNNGGYGENKFFDKQVVELFTIPNENNDTFGLGWRRQGNNYDYSWAFSPIASPNAYGHTGWTGTLTLIDPTEQLVIVLLTSKKNTPLIDKNLDTNVMEGDKFITGQYGSIVSIIYEIFSESSSDKLIDSTLIELFNQK